MCVWVERSAMDRSKSRNQATQQTNKPGAKYIKLLSWSAAFAWLVLSCLDCFLRWAREHRAWLCTSTYYLMHIEVWNVSKLNWRFFCNQPPIGWTKISRLTYRSGFRFVFILEIPTELKVKLLVRTSFLVGGSKSHPSWLLLPWRRWSLSERDWWIHSLSHLVLRLTFYIRKERRDESRKFTLT